MQCEVANYFLQLFGRAERGGSVARAHLFFNIRQKNRDPEVKAFCLGFTITLEHQQFGGMFP